MPEILRITAKAEHGIRRCGIRHLAVPTDHPVEDFTPEQLAVLESERDLIVERLDAASSKETGGDNPLPPGGGDRAAAIEVAIQQLDPADPEHFTKGNVPKVEAIEAVAGFELSAAERDAAWAALSGVTRSSSEAVARTNDSAARPTASLQEAAK